jgi:hypothetical protein
MMDGRRKSIQAMASRLPHGNEQNLQQFVNQSTWDPVPVRRRIARRLVPRIGPDAWAVDDVSFPKDGRMSVGVAPQYCGALGKQANCQIADDGYRESSEAWAGLLRDCARRGMRAPVLAVGDGALGFWNALSEVFPMTRHQRCWVHKTANCLDALPKSARPATKRAIQEICNA